MAWAQLSSQSAGVLRFGPSDDGAMTLPSGKITGSPPDLPVEGSGGKRSGRETLLMSVAVAPGGGSIGPLRPHPATLSAATSAPVAAIRARRSSDWELNRAPHQRHHIGRMRRQHDQLEHAHTSKNTDLVP